MSLQIEEARILERIFSYCNAAKLSDLSDSGNAATVESLLQSLISQGIVKRSMPPSVRCPLCNGPMDERLESTLVCTDCDYSIDLDERTRNEYSSFSVVEPIIAARLRGILKQNGLPLENGQIQIPVPSISYIGSIAKDRNGFRCDVVFPSIPLTESGLYALLGISAREQRFFVVAYSSLGKDLDQETVARIAPPSLRLLRFSELVTQECSEDIQRYLTTSEFLLTQVQSVAKTLNLQPNIAPTSDEARFIDQALTLGRVGRERFESVALRLLQVLGPAWRLEGHGYRPEGALFLPSGFCIVDAKSTSTFFKFDIDERDKMQRYIATLEKQAHRFGKYRFYGEIVLTRSLPEPRTDLLSKVEDYFQRARIESKVIVMSLEGLLNLYRRAWATPEFFHRIDLREHPLQLLKLDKRDLPSHPTAETGYRYITYVDDKRLASYFEHVMASPIIELDSRTKADLILLVSKAYERSF